MFKKVNCGKNMFCGPAAISIVTGASTDDAAWAIRDVCGLDRVKGTYGYQVRRALRERWGVDTALSFANKRVRDYTSGATFILAIEHRDYAHWIVVKGRKYCCSMTKTPTSIADIESLRVTEAIHVLNDPIRKTKRPPSVSSIRMWVKSQPGFDIDVLSHDSIGVFPDPEIDDDPYDDDHYVYSWAEARDRIKEYQSLATVGSTAVGK